METTELQRCLKDKAIVIFSAGWTDVDKIRQALGCEVICPDIGHNHKSFRTFEHFVERVDVAVVLISIKRCNHKLHECMAEACRVADKPFVRLPRCCNATQVVEQIKRQASKKLGVAAKS